MTLWFAIFTLFIVFEEVEEVEHFEIEDVDIVRILSYNRLGDKVLLNYYGRNPGNMGLLLYDLDKKTGFKLDRNIIRAFRAQVTVLGENFLVANLNNTASPTLYIITPSGELLQTLRLRNLDFWQPGFKLTQVFSDDDQHLFFNFTDTARKNTLIAGRYNPATSQLTEIMHLTQTEERQWVIIPHGDGCLIINKVTGSIKQRIVTKETEIFPGKVPVKFKGPYALPPNKVATSYYYQIFGYHRVGNDLQFECNQLYDAAGDELEKPEKHILIFRDGVFTKSNELIFGKKGDRELAWLYPKDGVVLK